MAPKYGTTDPCWSIHKGQPLLGLSKGFILKVTTSLWNSWKFLSLPSSACFHHAVAQRKQSQLPLYNSMSVCPSSRLSRPGWCSAPQRVPMATAEPLCSALGNFPLSRTPPCNKLSQSGFPAQPLVGGGTVLVLPAPSPGAASLLQWGGSACPHQEHITFPSGNAKNTRRNHKLYVTSVQKLSHQFVFTC